VTQSVVGFPVSRSLGNKKPGNHPKPSEDTGLPVSQASSRISQAGKPKVDLPKRQLRANDGKIVEKPVGSREAHQSLSRIDPALKSWLDNVIIPSLVRSYLVERGTSKRTQAPGKPPLAIESDGIYARHGSARKL
jgi:hypothetical protein